MVLSRIPGGAGTYRGGMGLRRVLTPVDHDCVFNGAGERFRHKPWGLFGGEDGGSGRFLIRDQQGERRLDDKPGEVQVGRDDIIIVETPGAGGYGPPDERNAGAIELDRQSNKFSDAYIEQHYGTKTRAGER